MDNIQRTYMTPTEAGARLGRSAGTIVRYVATGLLRADRIAGRLLLRRDAVERYLRGRDRAARVTDREEAAR